MADLAFGSSTLIVICPLTSLMIDQVNSLKSTCCSAASVYQGQDKTLLQKAEDGEYSLIYASTESMLGSKRWRKMLTSASLADNCAGVAVDEAHCIHQW